jgi:hypothetical protein
VQCGEDGFTGTVYRKDRMANVFAVGANWKYPPAASRSARIGALKNGSCVAIPDTFGSEFCNATEVSAPFAHWIA